MHNDTVLTIPLGGFFGAKNEDEEVCVGDTPLRKYTLRNIKPVNKKNKITRICKTCISSMLIQSDLNKWRLITIEKLDKLYIKFCTN